MRLLVVARSAALDVAVRAALLASDVSLRAFGLERCVRAVGARGSWSGGADSPDLRRLALPRHRMALVGVIMRRRAIWTRTNGPCLRQALLVCLVLRRYEPTMHLGMKSTDVGPMAHAWVSVGRMRFDHDPSYAAFGVGV